MRTPTVHLNGSSRDDLLENNNKAYRALSDAAEALQQAAPNGRDYYLQGPEAITEAQREHRWRLNAILGGMSDLAEIITAIEVQSIGR